MSYIETLIADRYTATGGATKEWNLPRNFTTCLIKIIQQGDHKTDLSTYAHRISALGEIEIITKRGGEIMIDAEDLHHFSSHLTRTMRTYEYDGGGGDADDEAFTVWYLPFAPHPTNWFTPAGLFGLPGSIADKIRIKYADLDAEIDSRELTIVACGIKGVKPVSYLTYRRNNFTMVIDSYKYCSVGSGRIGGVYVFHTSSPIQGDTTDTITTVKELNVVIDRKPVLGPHKTIADLFPGPGAVSPDDPVTMDAFLDSWTHWDLDPGRRGAGYPIVENMEISALGGVAEAARIYPIVYARV